MLIADVPPPTVREARVATVLAVRPMAQLFDGKLSVSKTCPRRKLARVCTARIVGPVSMRLRVRVRSSADGQSWLVSARPVRP